MLFAAETGNLLITDKRNISDLNETHTVIVIRETIVDTSTISICGTGSVQFNGTEDYLSVPDSQILIGRYMVIWTKLE